MKSTSTHGDWVYYRRLLERFPNVHALATADLDDVLKLWEGLGYYARARNLHKAANIVVGVHGGQLPRDVGSLRALPGIGRYVAAAILSIAFNQPALAIDGSVRRMLSPLHDLADPGDAAIRQRVPARKCMPGARQRDSGGTTGPTTGEEATPLRHRSRFGLA